MSRQAEPASTLPNYLADQWSPYLIYTAKMNQIKAWFLRYGRSALYNGKSWTLDYKRLCPGVYEVRFKESD